MSKIDTIDFTTPYIDRRVAEGIFRELFGEHSLYRVFNIYGKSGSGKTTFINHIRNKYLNKSDIVTIRIDFNNRLLHKSQNTIMHIAKELEDKYDFNFIALWKAYAILWHKRYENSPLMYAIDLPYFNEIKKIINPKKGNKIINIAKNIFGDKTSKELEELKNLDSNAIEESLHKFFATDIRRVLKDKKIKDCVIIFENLDILKENINGTPCSKDDWIRDIITQIGKDALFILTSKEQLNWQKCNSNWKSLLKSYEMKPFTQKDSLRYLRLSGIDNKNLKEAIAKSSGNEPFWLSLALLANKELENNLPISKKDILNSFIKSLNKNILDVLKILVHTRFFTIDLLYVASRKFEISISKDDITELLNLPFIKELDDNKLIIDDTLKDEFIKKQTKKEIAEYRSFIFSYYENILQSIDTHVVEATPKLIDEVLEEAWYHLNLINQEPLVHYEWLDYYIDRFYMFAAWEPFVERYSKIIPQLKEAKDSTSKSKLISIYNNLAGLYESLGDRKISKKYYNMVTKLNRPQLLSA